MNLDALIAALGLIRLEQHRQPRSPRYRGPDTIRCDGTPKPPVLKRTLPGAA